MIIDEYDIRHGGRWRYLSKEADGNEHGFHGVVHSAHSPEGFVRTSEYEGAPGHVTLDATTFSERDGKTLVRSVSCFQSVEDRDAMVASGMEHGVRDSDERLAELLATLRA